MNFQGHSLFVMEAYTEMRQGQLRHQYVLGSYQGFRQKSYYQEKLAGASLSGVVVDVRQDQVRIHLDCDEQQEINKAYWFNYSTAYSAEGHTGWYVMPEIGDPVSLYFPGSREEDGIAGSAVRRNTQGSTQNKISDPQMKIWRTPHGKEICLGSDELVITGKEGAIYIKLNDTEGIHNIVSNNAVSISAGGDMSLTAGKTMSLSAGSELRMDCNGSHIELSGSAKMKGSEVKSN